MVYFGFLGASLEEEEEEGAAGGLVVLAGGFGLAGGLEADASGLVVLADGFASAGGFVFAVGFESAGRLGVGAGGWEDAAGGSAAFCFPLDLAEGALTGAEAEEEAMGPAADASTAADVFAAAFAFLGAPALDAAGVCAFCAPFVFFFSCGTSGANVFDVGTELGPALGGASVCTSARAAAERPAFVGGPSTLTRFDDVSSSAAASTAFRFGMSQRAHSPDGVRRRESA
jgi:hypothetical protein